MSFMIFRQRCAICGEEWNASFGVVHLTKIASPPKVCPKCGSERLIKIADHWIMGDGSIFPKPREVPEIDRAHDPSVLRAGHAEEINRLRAVLRIISKEPDGYKCMELAEKALAGERVNEARDKEISRLGAQNRVLRAGIERIREQLILTELVIGVPPIIDLCTKLLAGESIDGDSK